VVRYLLVNDRDGRVLAELASAEQAARLLARYARNPDGDSRVSLVRLDHHEGSLTDVTSMVTMRVLPSLAPRRASTDRRSRHPRPTQPPRG
jgi:hypothetical protein